MMMGAAMSPFLNFPWYGGPAWLDHRENRWEIGSGFPAREFTGASCGCNATVTSRRYRRRARSRSARIGTAIRQQVERAMDARDMSQYSCRNEAFEAAEDIGCNPSAGPTMGDIIARRFGRRDMMRGSLAVAAITAAFGPLAVTAARQAEAAQTGANGTKARFSFDELERGVDRTHHVAKGYNADILIRWGDPVLPGAPEFDPMNQTAEKQKQQFGYNNDFVGYVELPLGSNDPEHGLLCVNHEYTDEEVMFPGVGGDQMEPEADFAKMTRELVDIEMAAHGGSVLEIRRTGGKWAVVKDSRYARRITGSNTEIAFTGPAAGSDRMKTKADPAGRTVIGMLNNCAGGITPWGTWLSAEENVNGYFQGKLADGHAESANYKRMGIPGKW
jgi:hypothetical protein